MFCGKIKTWQKGVKMKINNLVKREKDPQIIDGKEIEQIMRQQLESAKSHLKYRKEAEIFVEIYEEDIEKRMDLLNKLRRSGPIGSGRKTIGSLPEDTIKKQNLVSIVAKEIANRKKNNKQLTMKEIFTNKTIVFDIIARACAYYKMFVIKQETKKKTIPLLFSEAEKKMMDTIRKIRANKKVSPYIRRSNDDMIK